MPRFEWEDIDGIEGVLIVGRENVVEFISYEYANIPEDTVALISISDPTGSDEPQEVYLDPEEAEQVVKLLLKEINGRS